jgi:hypothetical protein
LSALKIVSPLMERAKRDQGEKPAASTRGAGERPRTAKRRAELWKEPVPFLEDRDGRLHLLL